MDRQVDGSVVNSGTYAFRTLGTVDLQAIEALRDTVIADLPDPDHYVREDRTFIADHLSEKGQTFGAFLGDRLVGYGALGLPVSGDENLGSLVGLADGDLERVAHMASAMVLPSHRRRGVHTALLNHRFAGGLAAGRSHFVAMVSPRNQASWSSLMRAGFVIRQLHVMYGSLDRFLMHYDYDRRPAFDVADARICPTSDLDRQRELIADGFLGWKPGPGNDTASVVYAHPVR